MTPNKLFQLAGVSTHKLVYLLSVFENLEGWHGSDSNFLGYILLLININLHKLDRTELWLGGQLFKNWAHESARTAPWGPIVDYHDLARVGKCAELVKASEARKIVNYVQMETVEYAIWFYKTYLLRAATTPDMMRCLVRI